MAASKAAVAAGASKVAVLDFVKASPAGTSWGLGGTCVNVGCIPKKLMHNAALINEGIHADTAAFGLKDAAAGTHSWEDMRTNIQQYIRGLNFKYRVNLRENDISYLNKLSKFKDNHTILATNKKGVVEEITAARFLVAVGGRPTALDCEGGELVISSDDIFALEKSPGKTLCVGASYISLECAGFLAGIGLDVTIAVRSILLRGFDRECADLIGDYMESNIKFRKEGKLFSTVFTSLYLYLLVFRRSVIQSVPISPLIPLCTTSPKIRNQSSGTEKARKDQRRRNSRHLLRRHTGNVQHSPSSNRTLSRHPISRPRHRRSEVQREERQDHHQIRTIVLSQYIRRRGCYGRLSRTYSRGHPSWNGTRGASVRWIEQTNGLQKYLYHRFHPH